MFGRAIWFQWSLPCLLWWPLSGDSVLYVHVAHIDNVFFSREGVPVCLLKNIMFSGLDTFAISAGFLQLLRRVVAEGSHFISFGQEDLRPFPQTWVLSQSRAVVPNLSKAV